MQRKAKCILGICIVAGILTISGCWDKREINELGLVTSVGIDKAAKRNQYMVTVEIANPSVSNATAETSGSGQSGGGSVWIASATGDSIFDATRNLVNISSRRIMWAHNSVIIIGAPLAREGIAPVVDYFTHQPELRLKAAVVVAKGDAKDYIPTKIGMDTPNGTSFILMQAYRSLAAESANSHMLEVATSLASKHGNPLIAEIRLKNAIRQPNAGNSSGAKNPQTVEMAGAAVFKKDRMIGWLTPTETRGSSWILNQTKNTVVTVTDPAHHYKNVSVETSDVKAMIKTTVKNGMPRISIRITGNGTIAEEDGKTSLGINQMKKHVAVLVDRKIESEVRHTLSVVQNKYGVDVLGFAAIVHVQNDREWESGLMDQWETIFPMIPVQVSADIHIKSSRLNQEPMRIPR
ncbi:MAG: Ger(x)C family spore germination protein [Solirubrobacterales bacterium]